MEWQDAAKEFKTADDKRRAELYALVSNRLAEMDEYCFSCEENEHSELRRVLQQMPIPENFLTRNGYVLKANEENILQWVRE